MVRNIKYAKLAFLFLLFSCYHASKNIYVHQSIEFPFKYYVMSENSKAIPKPAFWDNRQSLHLKEKNYLHFFTSNPINKIAYKHVQKNQLSKAKSLLKAQLNKKLSNTEIGFIYNNLAIIATLSTQNTTAQEFIQEAGIKLPENQKVLQNARLIYGLSLPRMQIRK